MINHNLLRAVDCLLDYGFAPTAIDETSASYGDLFSLDVGRTLELGESSTVSIHWTATTIVWEQLQLMTYSGWCFSKKSHHANDKGFAPHVGRDFERLLKEYNRTVAESDYQDDPDEDDEHDDHLGAGLSKASCDFLSKVVIDQPVTA